jgi:hypothetical protein
MCFSVVRPLAGVVLAAAISSPAAAQFSIPRADPAVGERYTVEFGAFLWNPTPDIVVQSEGISLAGTPVDLVNDLGVVKERRPDFRLVLRPFRKHKFRLSYIPIHYQAETILERTVVFEGTIFRVGLPLSSDFEWKAWRIGYEYDFIARDRGFVGFVLEAKYTDVKLDVAAGPLFESASARVPIPAIGGIFRVYPAPFLAITGEVGGIRLPGSLTEGDETAHYLDWDLSATVNVTPNVGVQVGYRVLDLGYRYDEDFGDLRLTGIYFGALARF